MRLYVFALVGRLMHAATVITATVIAATVIYFYKTHVLYVVSALPEVKQRACQLFGKQCN
jgi:uncharacterized membrane protein YecN with MAPEG domain